MNKKSFDTPDPVGKDEGAPGAERYLNTGENLRIYSSDIQIKKFRFESYLTNKRLFFIDQSDRNLGITAKEIPVESILSGYLEESTLREPVLVLTVRTSDDDTRTMKMVFVHTGEDRAREAEDWVHLISQAASTAVPESDGEREPAIAPGARALTDTIIFPASGGSEIISEKNVPPPAQSSARSVPDPVSQRSALEQVQPTTASSPSPDLIHYCYHCGKKLPEKANFCPFCGTRVHETPHEPTSHLHLPLHQTRDHIVLSPEEPKKKTGWRRFFGR